MTNKLYFVCTNTDCLNFDRPFSLTANQLQDDDIPFCEYCDRLCVLLVQPIDQVLAAIGEI